MSRRFRTCSGRSTLSEPDRLQNEFERALHHPIPYRRNPEQPDLPTVVRKLDLPAPTPIAFRGRPRVRRIGQPLTAIPPSTLWSTAALERLKPEQPPTH